MAEDVKVFVDPADPNRVIYNFSPCLIYAVTTRPSDIPDISDMNSDLMIGKNSECGSTTTEIGTRTLKIRNTLGHPFECQHCGWQVLDLNYPDTPDPHLLGPHGRTCREIQLSRVHDS